MIYPYSISINLTTWEGINSYKKIINPDNACIRQTVSVETATCMMDLFKDKEIQYGLDDIFRVPKSVTGVADANPFTLPGSKLYNVYLEDFTNILKDYHHLTGDHTMNFSGWIYSDESQKLKKSTDMVVKDINPNAEENQGMVTRLKIHLRILSGVVHMTFKNHVTLLHCWNDKQECRWWAYYSKAHNRRDEASAHCQRTGTWQAIGETITPNKWQRHSWIDHKDVRLAETYFHSVWK